MEKYFRFGEKWVCPDCLTEADLQDYIRNNAEGLECSYCKNAYKTPTTINVSMLAEYIGECLSLELATPDDAGIMWNSREGGWQCDGVYFASEILSGWGCPNGIDAAINSESEELVDDIAQELPDQLCYNYAGFFADEEASHIWFFFKECLKHKLRFLYFHPSAQTVLVKSSDMIYQSLDYPFKLLAEGIEAFGLLQTLNPGTRFIRIRQWNNEDDGSFNSAKNMGPPSAGNALKPNRMSPAGIPMFYGSFDRKTALAEVQKNTTSYAYAAEFTSLRPLRVIDFKLIPRYMPSIYSQERYQRALIRFLQDVKKEISAPLEGDEKAHIDYIPTQAIAEWLRYAYRPDNLPIDGIIFESSLGTGECVALFLDNNDCIDNSTSQRKSQKASLELTGFEMVKDTSLNLG